MGTESMKGKKKEKRPIKLITSKTSEITNNNFYMPRPQMGFIGTFFASSPPSFNVSILILLFLFGALRFGFTERLLMKKSWRNYIDYRQIKFPTSAFAEQKKNESERLGWIFQRGLWCTERQRKIFHRRSLNSRELTSPSFISIKN